MSIAFESGPRLRPIDVRSDDGDEVAIDGTRLRLERIERGLSVPEAARLVTLSREQVEQIENGGLGAFYGARHKLLAVRKYAQGFGIALEDLMPGARPAIEPVSAPDVAAEAGDAAEAAEPVAPQVVPVPDIPVAALPVATNDEGSSADAVSAATGSRLPLVLLAGILLVLALFILRSLTAPSTPAEALPEPAVAVAVDADAAVQAADTSTPAVDAQAQPAAAATSSDAVAADVCALNAGPDTPRWAPPQARVASTRLFLSSAAPIDVCVTDAAGVSTPMKLKPGAMVSASGKPPYIVRSEQLSQAQIFLQGLKVRVPASAVAVQLVTTTSVRAPDATAVAGQ